MDEAVRLHKAGDLDGALAALDRSEARNGKSYNAEILRGWTYHRMKRWDDARKVFQAQDKIRSTAKTRYGIGATANSQYNMWPETPNNCKTWAKC